MLLVTSYLRQAHPSLCWKIQEFTRKEYSSNTMRTTGGGAQGTSCTIPGMRGSQQRAKRLNSPSSCKPKALHILMSLHCKCSLPFAIAGERWTLLTSRDFCPNATHHGMPQRYQQSISSRLTRLEDNWRMRIFKSMSKQ